MVSSSRSAPTWRRTGLSHCWQVSAPVRTRRAGGDERFGLSARELEVLALVARGLSNPRIAETLVLSEHTVRRHVANILRKLDAPSRSAAAALAARHELI